MEFAIASLTLCTCEAEPLVVELFNVTLSPLLLQLPVLSLLSRLLACEVQLPQLYDL